MFIFRLQPGDELLKHGNLLRVEPTLLRQTPGLKRMAPVDLDILQKDPGEQRGEVPEPQDGEAIEPVRGGGRQIEGIDCAACAADVYGAVLCLQSPLLRIVEQGAQLAKAPAQFAARIVWSVPEKVAELATTDWLWREREIGKKRANLARLRQFNGNAVPHHSERPERLDRKGQCSRRFHGRYHDGFHAGCTGRIIT